MLQITLRITLCLFSLSLFSLSFSGYALENDQEQTATLDADEFDIDLQTGVRIYRGNVIYRQGSIKLTADEIVAYFKEGALERAVATGKPGNLARFSQRPEGKDTDIVGVALRIELDDAKQFIVLQNKAKINQDAHEISGEKITYDLNAQRLKVTSEARTTEAADASESAATRPRLVIAPRSTAE